MSAFPTSSPLTAPATRRVALLAGLALVLGACGRRGPLEPPPGTAALGPDGKPVPATDAPAASSPAIGPTPFRGAPRGGAAVQRPNRPFILDPLL